MVDADSDAVKAWMVVVTLIVWACWIFLAALRRVMKERAVQIAQLAKSSWALDEELPPVEICCKARWELLARFFSLVGAFWLQFDPEVKLIVEDHTSEATARGLGRITTIITVVVIAKLALRIDSYLFRFSKIQHGVDRTRVRLAKLGSHVFIIGVATYTVLFSFGFNAAQLAGSTALLSFVFLFFLQNALNNFLGTIYIVTQKTFQVGDYVSFLDVTGTVRKIELQSTWIQTGDRIMHIIPNRKVLEVEVQNQFFDDKQRIMFQVEVLSCTPVEAIDKAALEVHKLWEAEPDLCDNWGQPYVSIMSVDRYSYKLNVRAFFLHGPLIDGQIDKEVRQWDSKKSWEYAPFLTRITHKMHRQLMSALVRHGARIFMPHAASDEVYLRNGARIPVYHSGRVAETALFYADKENDNLPLSSGFVCDTDLRMRKKRTQHFPPGLRLRNRKKAEALAVSKAAEKAAKSGRGGDMTVTVHSPSVDLYGPDVPHLDDSDTSPKITSPDAAGARPAQQSATTPARDIQPTVAELVPPSVASSPQDSDDTMSSDGEARDHLPRRAPLLGSVRPGQPGRL